MRGRWNEKDAEVLKQSLGKVFWSRGRYEKGFTVTMFLAFV